MFFVWMAVCSKILTLDNLRRRGMVVVNRCWLCETEGKSVGHLLLHCAAVSGLWNAFSLGLAFAGLCLTPSRSYSLVGRWEVIRGALLFGKWSLIVLCGVFGGSEIIDVSRTRRGLKRSSFIFFFLLSTLGLQAGLSCGSLAL